MGKVLPTHSENLRGIVMEVPLSLKFVGDLNTFLWDFPFLYLANFLLLEK